MGYEMAFNLFSKQHALASDSQFVICDAVPASTTRFRDAFMAQFPGAQLSIASSPEEAALVSQTIITMLPASPHVLSVYNAGILPGLQTLSRSLRTTTFCIDSTTLDVSVAKDVASAVTATGAQMVDAPVSGGVTGAKAGTLSFLVGGETGAFASVQPVLSMMGSRAIHCGPTGAGLAAKICNNMLLGVQQIATAEAMLLGQKLGLDPAVLTSVIGSSTGSCWSVNVNNPVPGALVDKAPPCERDYEGGFATALMLKDMGLAATVAEQAASPSPLGEAAGQIYAKIAAERPDLTRKDFSSVYAYLKDKAETGQVMHGEAWFVRAKDA